MELTYYRRKKGELNLPLVYLLVAGAGLFSIAVLHFFHRLPHFPCVFKAMTGLPCPTCGSTRIVTSLLDLDILAALHWNPLVFLGGIAFFTWVVYGFYMLASGKKIRVRLSNKESLYLKLGLVLLFLLNWIYLVILKI